jgi:hypothetical protein
MLALVLVGCATSIPDYSETLDSWVGLNVDGLVREWGKASGIVSISEGHSVYSYEVSGTRKLPARAKYVGGTYQVFPGPTIVETCNTYFEADSNGLIVNRPVLKCQRESVADKRLRSSHVYIVCLALYHGKCGLLQ